MVGIELIGEQAVVVPAQAKPRPEPYEVSDVVAMLEQLRELARRDLP